MSLAVIAGLGNPGSKYRNTRHNIGFSVIDAFAESIRAKWNLDKTFQAQTASANSESHKLLLVKPQTFMNDSGRSLSSVLRYKKLPANSLLIIYDDINLELGQAKLNASGSAGGHNGIADILSKIEPDFLRYRIGIGSKPHKQMNLADFVLGQFSSEEQETLINRTPTYLEHLQLIIDKGPLLAMNLINQRTSTNA